MIRVWVDADSMPREVRALLCRWAERGAIDVVFCANRPPATPAGCTEHVSVQHVTAGSVDDRIVDRLAPGDVVVTRDIRLAERVLHRGGRAINDRGTVFDPAAIAERRSLRDAAAAIRAAGLETMPRARGYGARQKKAFADAFDKLLNTLDRS